MGSRKRAQQRIAEIRARNPKALPSWLTGSGTQDKAWYRVSWQTDNGIAAADAARPVILVLDWLARRGLLTSTGISALRAAQAGDVGSLGITESMVQPKASAFLDQQFEQWWEAYGINLTISAACEDVAKTGIVECWRRFGTDD